ncbi:hemolysin D [Sulfitobacter donghicola DSW-25 = KCTC 12864 = JCM 14565]|uniref:Hemolysin D n=2 Tax=Sulfitobacter TaxID=60136 RepID=A0A073IUJ6_9RHOB|nr:hemolysin D [Sulfitobacter donghicola DSW-25 = KCTC 12864 = JCM 14565]
MRIFGQITIALSLLVVASVSDAQDTVPRLVKTMTVSSSVPEAERQFFGHVVAKETVDIAFQVGGQIVSLPITEGETIAAGDVIAVLDLEPFELALDQAQVQRTQSRRTFERLKKLQGGTVSKVSVDDAETQLELSELAVRDAERALRNAQLTAPFEALIASRNVANFTTINAGTPVVRLHDMSDLRIEIDVPEVLFQQAGKNPNITLSAKFPASDEMFPLQVREFNAETSEVGQTFQITLGMTPPEGLVVLPGSSVTVFATQNDLEPEKIIPHSAVVNAPNGTTEVMIFTSTGDDTGTVSAVPVEITPGNHGEVIVTSGLEDGIEFVASGANLLSDGDQVRRFTGFAN